jgi:hypothetical protein
MTGPLWLESMTSLGPEVRVWRHVSFAVLPACRVMTVEVFAVGFGPPLQTMSFEETSFMGCERVRWRATGLGGARDLHRRMWGRGHRLLLRRH